MLCGRRMELPDLPNHSATTVVDSAPLWVVCDMLRAGGYELAVVVNDVGAVRGVVPRDAVERLSARVPEAPMKMVPMRRALVISSETTMRDAISLLSNDDVEALLLERSGARGFTALVRDDLPATEPEPRAIAV